MAGHMTSIAVGTVLVMSSALMPIAAHAEWQTSTGPDTDGTEVTVLTNRSETGHVLFVSCRADGLAGIGLLERDNQTDMTSVESESGIGQLAIANDEYVSVQSPADIFRLDEEVIVVNYTNVEIDLYDAISLIEGAAAEVIVTFAIPSFDYEAAISFDATGSTAGARVLRSYCLSAGISE